MNTNLWIAVISAIICTASAVYIGAKKKSKDTNKKESSKIKMLFKIFAVILTTSLIFELAGIYITPNREKFYFNSTQENTDKMIALTFDDGPGPYTDELLDGLEKLNAKASFFLVGEKIKSYPDTVAKIAEKGHLIGNHTYSHIKLTALSPDEIKKEIDKTNEEIKAITGEAPQFFRPPFGRYNSDTLNYVDMISVRWSKDTIDWKYEDEERLYRYLIKNAGDGEIFLMHDVEKTTVKGVLRAIETLQKQGYKFVRADELLCRNGDGLLKGIGYRKCEKDKPPVHF